LAATGFLADFSHLPSLAFHFSGALHFKATADPDAPASDMPAKAIALSAIVSLRIPDLHLLSTIVESRMTTVMCMR
jgi:hypothetical protein